LVRIQGQLLLIHLGNVLPEVINRLHDKLAGLSNAPHLIDRAFIVANPPYVLYCHYVRLDAEPVFDNLSSYFFTICQQCIVKFLFDLLLSRGHLLFNFIINLLYKVNRAVLLLLNDDRGAADVTVDKAFAALLGGKHIEELA
jgi:hypothetical protein